MKLLTTLFAAFAAAAAATNSSQPAVGPNGCVNFSVSAGTGCAWMCNYCSGALGTNNYYFTTDVCTYQEGTGCVGNPLAGVTYTCCAASEETEEEFVCEDEPDTPTEAEWEEEITEIRITEIRRRY
jgi:hypothetical protein